MVSSSIMPPSAKSDVPLNGRVALVTGSAKRLGRAVALRLAKEGADGGVHHRSSSAEAQRAVAEIKKLGRRGVAVAADLSQLFENRRVFEENATELCRLPILINKA